MATSETAASRAAFPFPYINCRNISDPDDEAAGRKVYSGKAPASSVLSLEDDENVREYLVDARGKLKRVPTLVHQAIRKTLEDIPDQFSILNGGMVIVARGAEIDDKNRVMMLRRPSIINGSQTQGELQRYFEKFRISSDFFEPKIKFELIVTDDDDLIAEISIARNFQNDVRAISIAGRRGQLDELEAAVQKAIPDAKLRMSETDLVADGKFLDTEKLIQVVFALMPAKLLKGLDRDGDPSNKAFTYSQKTRCLKLFQRLVEEREGNSDQADAYRYFLDIAGEAWTLYERWKVHQGFRGTRIRSIERDGGEIADVPDGIIFPILSALSAFATHGRKGWTIYLPDRFDEKELIEAAAQVYMEIANHNPQTMGKNKACYSALFRLTSIYARLAAIMDQQRRPASP
jgi:AIPR protein